MVITNNVFHFTWGECGCCTMWEIWVARQSWMEEMRAFSTGDANFNTSNYCFYSKWAKWQLSLKVFTLIFLTETSNKIKTPSIIEYNKINKASSHTYQAIHIVWCAIIQYEIYFSLFANGATFVYMSTWVRFHQNKQ